MKVKCFAFDSQKEFEGKNAEAKYFRLVQGAELEQVAKRQQINDKLIGLVNSFIAREFQLTVYGIDVLISSALDKYYIVDFNYFPGFKEVQNKQQLFHEHIKRLLAEFNEK